MNLAKILIKKKFNKFNSLFYFWFESFTFLLREKIINQRLNFNFNNKKLLDVGCGTGSNSLIFAKQGADVFGIDLSVNQINSAINRKTKYKNLKHNFKIMDAEKLKFEDNIFDFAICSFSLHELGNLEILNNTINEIKRVLKPRAKFIIVDYNLPQNKLFKVIYTKIVFSFEPKETTNKILNTSFLNFAKNFNLKPNYEKLCFLSLIKLWVYQTK